MNKNQQYDATVNKLKQVVRGERGWCAIGHAVAGQCGTNVASLRIVAQSLGLNVRKHGRHGIVASK